MSVSESAIPAIHDDPRALAGGGTPEQDPGASEQSGPALGLIERALDNMLALRRQDPSRWVTLAQRLLSFTELDDLLSKIETGGRSDLLTALAQAVDIRFTFNGLENL